MGFRNDFLWGGAIAACQTEGAWNEEGKTLTFPDIVKKIKPEQRRNFGQAQIDEQALEADVYKRQAGFRTSDDALSKINSGMKEKG